MFMASEAREYTREYNAAEYKKGIEEARDVCEDLFVCIEYAAKHGENSVELKPLNGVSKDLSEVARISFINELKKSFSIYGYGVEYTEKTKILCISW